MGKKTFAFVLLLMLSFSVSYAEEKMQKKQQTGFMYGVGSAAGTSIYKGVDTEFLPFPFLGYKGEKLNIFGPFLSYDAFSTQGMTLALKLNPRFDSYKSSDSPVFRGMKDRKMSADAGIGAKYVHEGWGAEISGMVDILGRSDGFEVESKIGRSFGRGLFFINPFVGFSFLDRKHVDYYYGVEHDEVIAGRNYFKGRASFNPLAGVSVVTPVVFNGLTRVVITHKWYDTNITDSPLTDETSSISIFMTYSRFF